MSHDAPYAGLKVLDISQGVAGPYTGMLMAQHGAEVVKVEPLEGDWARGISRRFGDHTAFSVPSNLGKRSIALDLKSAAGKAIVAQLAASADVFIEGFRPGVAARLGFGYEEVTRIRPDVVYVSVSGFGQTGPMRDRPAMDPVLQAFSGLMNVNKGGDGVPHRVGVIVCDMATALYAFQALAVALYARRDTGHGRKIEASLMQASACFQVVRMMNDYLAGGETQPGRQPAGCFATADGHLNMLVNKEWEFPLLCEILGRPELKDDPRYATNAARLENAATLTPIVQEAFAARSFTDLSAALAEAGIMHEKVASYFDFLDHPQVAATGLVAWLDQPGVGRVPVPNMPGLVPLASGSARAHAPTLGEHTDAVLRELGYDDAGVARLRADGAVA